MRPTSGSCTHRIRRTSSKTPRSGNGIGAHPAGALIMSAFGSFRSLRGLWCAGGEATVGYELLASKKRRFV